MDARFGVVRDKRGLVVDDREVDDRAGGGGRLAHERHGRRDAPAVDHAALVLTDQIARRRAQGNKRSAMLYRSRGARRDISRVVASSRDRGVGGRSRGPRPRVGERRRHTRTVSRRAARPSQTNARRPHHRPDGLSREETKTVGTRTIPRATTRREFDPKTENDRALFDPTTEDTSAPPQTTTRGA